MGHILGPEGPGGLPRGGTRGNPPPTMCREKRGLLPRGLSCGVRVSKHSVLGLAGQAAGEDEQGYGGHPQSFPAMGSAWAGAGGGRKPPKRGRAPPLTPVPWAWRIELRKERIPRVGPDKASHLLGPQDSGHPRTLTQRSWSSELGAGKDVCL